MGAHTFPQRETTTGESIATEIRKLVADHLRLRSERVSDEARFIEDLGADWLDRLELLIAIEDQFASIEIAADAADQFVSVGDLIRFVEAGAAMNSVSAVR